MNDPIFTTLNSNRTRALIAGTVCFVLGYMVVRQGIRMILTA